MTKCVDRRDEMCLDRSMTNTAPAHQINKIVESVKELDSDIKARIADIDSMEDSYTRAAAFDELCHMLDSVVGEHVPAATYVDGFGGLQSKWSVGDLVFWVDDDGAYVED